ncbi:MAG: hypothetical protein KC646_09035 [Candidatus Cloacimonetes bacterium]|nr:hypothetical protein [Candidatus Cloacimonadota bacterium]
MRAFTLSTYFIFLHLFFYTVCADSSLVYDELILKDKFINSINSSLKFFENRQNSDGSFIYDVEPFTGRTTYKGNMVRQAGSLLSLAFSYDGVNKDQKRVIDNSISYFLSNVSEFSYKGKTLMIISENNEAYTGTICLFLSSYFYLHSQFKDQFPINNKAFVGLMNTLEDFVSPKGGITEYINISETYLDRIGRGSEIYASSQHFLTLAIFHYAFKRSKMSPTLATYLDLYDREWAYGDIIPSYLWVMLSHLFLSRHGFPDQINQIKENIENLQSSYDDLVGIKYIKSNYCTQLEGFSYYLLYKQETNTLNRFLFYRLTKHLRYSLNFQITSGLKKVISKVETTLKKPQHTIGGFWHKQSDVYHTRVDYTQHCLSAYNSHQMISNNMIRDVEEYDEIERLAQVRQLEVDARKTIEYKRMHRVIPKVINKY